MNIRWMQINARKQSIDEMLICVLSKYVTKNANQYEQKHAVNATIWWPYLGVRPVQNLVAAFYRATIEVKIILNETLWKPAILKFCIGRTPKYGHMTIIWKIFKQYQKNPSVQQAMAC